MSAFDRHDPDGAGELPCAVGLLASTLMLMTGVAVPAPGPDPDPEPGPDGRADARAQRHVQARRIVANLYFLQHHPALPPGLRQVAAHLHARWVSVAQPASPDRPAHTGANLPTLH